ncbi:MAG: YajQ family cyclic di-GMP-binding protein [Acidobacteriota bacterium]|nr:MAG: YajQ family cyclic di-GMP-binding protein [Acidobacteriota bacterium]
MAKSNSFDIVSKTDLNEVRNAVNQTVKEVRQRFDFKGSCSNVDIEEGTALVLHSDDDYKLRSLTEILEQKLVKRGVSLKALSPGKVEPAAGGSVRQTVSIQQGIPTEKAKEISKFIRDTKLKVQASIQGDTVRVSGKDRDVLQQVIALLREKDFQIDMQFTNYRSQ